MKPNKRAKKYATALLTVSKELNCIPKTGTSLQIIEQLVKQEKVFRVFLYTQRIEPAEKVIILKSVLGDKINPVVYEFFQFLAKRNEYDVFKSLATEYLQLQKESLNQIDVIAYSMEAIDKDMILNIVQIIENS
ncbi:MAG: F0F1 ATP synthase subunit delta, partial [Candidatus Neomarinimicrobiota bacterium]